MYPGMCDDRVGCGAAGLSGESNRRLELAIEIQSLQYNEL